jgi:hypothetical protein
MLRRTIVTAPAGCERAAWSAGHLLAADTAGNVWLDGRPLGRHGRPGLLALSRSGAEALVVREQPRSVHVWSGATELEIAGPDGRDCVDAAFVVRDGQTCIAIAYRHEIVLHHLDGSIAARQPLGGLAVGSLHPVTAGTALAIHGAEFGESRDTVALFGAAEMPVPPPTIGQRFQFTEGLVDSADRLAVGPAGSDNVIIYRDGEGEEPLDDEDAGAIVPREWGFTGFYVATPSGETLHRIDWDEKVARGSQLAASARYIALGTDGAIHVISRTDSSRERLDLTWLSTTPTGDRVLAKTSGGALELLEL